MKTLVSESLFNKVAGLQLYYKEAPAQVFSYEYCEIFRNTYTEKHLSTAARRSGCSVGKMQITGKVELQNPILISLKVH